MGKSKKSSSNKAPAAPKTTPPVSVSTPFGGGTYDKKSNAYNFSSADEGRLAQNQSLGDIAFGDSLQALQNPTDVMQAERDRYRSLMVPQFENTMQQQLGNAQAGLGKRYNSTFGQLTLGKMAQDQGLARANLESSIYNSGYDAYNRLLGQASGLGTLANQAQQARYEPYRVAGSLIGIGGQNVANYNNALANIYNTQMQGYLQQQQMQRAAGNSMMSSAGALAGALGGGLLAIPTGGMSIAAGAGLGSSLGAAGGNFF